MVFTTGERGRQLVGRSEPTTTRRETVEVADGWQPIFETEEVRSSPACVTRP